MPGPVSLFLRLFAREIAVFGLRSEKIEKKARRTGRRLDLFVVGLTSVEFVSLGVRITTGDLASGGKGRETAIEREFIGGLMPSLYSLMLKAFIGRSRRFTYLPLKRRGKYDMKARKQLINATTPGVFKGNDLYKRERERSSVYDR